MVDCRRKFSFIDRAPRMCTQIPDQLLVVSPISRLNDDTISIAFFAELT